MLQYFINFIIRNNKEVPSYHQEHHCHGDRLTSKARVAGDYLLLGCILAMRKMSKDFIDFPPQGQAYCYISPSWNSLLLWMIHIMKCYSSICLQLKKKKEEKGKKSVPRLLLSLFRLIQLTFFSCEGGNDLDYPTQDTNSGFHINPASTTIKIKSVDFSVACLITQE